MPKEYFCVCGEIHEVSSFTNYWGETMNTKLCSKQLEKLNSKLRKVWSYDAEQGEGKIIFSQENDRLHVAEA